MITTTKPKKEQLMKLNASILTMEEPIFYNQLLQQLHLKPDNTRRESFCLQMDKLETNKKSSTIANRCVPIMMIQKYLHLVLEMDAMKTWSEELPKLEEEAIASLVIIIQKILKKK